MRPIARRVATVSGAVALLFVGLALGAAPASALPNAVAAGADPVAVVAGADGATAYVLNRSPNPAVPGSTITVIDTASGSIRTTIPVGPESFALAISHDGANVYTVGVDNVIYEVDTATDAVSRKITGAPLGNPSALALSPDDLTLYVSNVNARFVDVDLAASPTTFQTVELNTPTRGIAISPDGKTAYVALVGASAVARVHLDTLTEDPAERITVGAEPWFVTYNSVAPARYFVTSANATPTLSAIDATTNTVIGTVPTNPGPRAIGVSPDGARIYVATLDNSGATVYNRVASTVNSLPTGASGEGLFVPTDGKRLFVTDVGSGGRLLIYNQATFSGPIDDTVTEGGTATFSSNVSGEADALQWQTSTDGGATWTAIPGATSESYTTGVTSVADSGVRFRLNVASIAFNDVQSPVAVLTVAAVPPIPTPGGGGSTGGGGLAATGSDPLTATVLAALLVAIGAGIFIIRPRRRRS